MDDVQPHKLSAPLLPSAIAEHDEVDDTSAESHELDSVSMLLEGDHVQLAENKSTNQSHAAELQPVSPAAAEISHQLCTNQDLAAPERYVEVSTAPDRSVNRQTGSVKSKATVRNSLDNLRRIVASHSVNLDTGLRVLRNSFGAIFLL